MAVYSSPAGDRSHWRYYSTKPFITSFKIQLKKIFMFRFLTAVILITGLLLQSCSKKSGSDTGPEPIEPVVTGNLKSVPDSMFRAYLKATICPNAFDKTG